MTDDLDWDELTTTGELFGVDGSTYQLWRGQDDDPWALTPPWTIAKRAPAGRVVQAARAWTRRAAREPERNWCTKYALQQWADCLWLWAWIAWMEGR